MNINTTIELKDLILISFSFITVTASLFSIIVSIKNRRNGIREELYKRQFNLVVEIFEAIESIEDLIITLKVQMESSQKDEFEITAEEFEKALDRLDFLEAKSELLLPDILYSQMHNFNLFLKKYDNSISENKNIDLRPLLYKETDFIDNLREFIGVERLSTETRELLEKKYI